MVDTYKEQLNSEQIRTLTAVRDFLTEICSLRNNISGQSIAYLLDLVINEGSAPSEVAKRCKAERTAVSKQLSTFTTSSNNLRSTEALGIIKAVQDPTYWRQKNLYYTPKGRKLMDELLNSFFEGGYNVNKTEGHQIRDTSDAQGEDV